MSYELSDKEKKQLTNNLYTFYRFFVASNFEENLSAPHIKKLAYVLMDLVNNKLGKDRVGVAMPPQHSKSSLVTLAFSIWYLCRNPKKRILIVNSEKTLSTTFGLQIHQLLEYVLPFFGLRLSHKKSSSTHMRIEDKDGLTGGVIELTGAGGGITGRPVDLLIVDDPYKGLEDELTPTQLEKKWSWYSNIVEQRVRDGGRTKLVILHTRWHSEDIQGRIKSDEAHTKKYYFVEFAAIDKNNKPLWSEYYSLEFYLEKQALMGDRRFQAEYQQTPLDLTGDFFPVDLIHWEDALLDEYYWATCRSYDMAYTPEKKALEENKDADYTTGCEAFKLNNYHYHYQDFLNKRLGSENIRYVQNKARQDGLNKNILIETGTKGGASEELFRLWDKDYLPEYKCTQSEPWGTKLDRATALKYAMHDGKIHIHCNNKKLRKTIIEQLEAFPNGTHDDIVDAMSYAYLWLKDKGKSDDIYCVSSKRHGRRRNRR